MTYRTYICGPTDCPRDPAFEHDNYYGCVPKNFNQRTGRSKTHHQTKVVTGPGPMDYRYHWNGGCDALVDAH